MTGKVFVGNSRLAALAFAMEAALFASQGNPSVEAMKMAPEPEPEPFDDPDITPPRPIKPQYSGMTSQTAAFQQGQDDFNNNEPNAESSFSRPERDMYRNGWTLAKQKAKRS